MKRLFGVLLVGLVALALSGCTLIATNAKPAHIPRSNVGFSLLNKTIPGTNGGRVRFETQPVYIVDATGHLAPSSRIVPSPASLDAVVSELLIGPSAIEKSAGYSSALPKKLVLISATVRGGIGYINFASSLESLPLRKQILGIGQLVLTAYIVGATKGIVVQAAGVPQELLTADGERSVLVTRTDYLSLQNG